MSDFEKKTSNFEEKKSSFEEKSNFEEKKFKCWKEIQILRKKFKFWKISNFWKNQILKGNKQLLKTMLCKLRLCGIVKKPKKSEKFEKNLKII